MLEEILDRDVERAGLEPKLLLHLVGQVGLAGELRRDRLSLRLHHVGESVVLQLTEPHGDLVRLVRLEQLMNTGRTQAGGTRYLPDGQPRILRCNNGPDPFPLGVG